jgi:hypothetical protein
MSWYPFNPATYRTIKVTAGTLDQSFVAHEHIVAVLGSTLSPLATVTLTTPTVHAASTTFLVQPDVPRNLVLTGNAGANEAVTVNGLAADGVTAVQEVFTLSGTDAQVGAKAFKTLTSVTYAAGTHTCAFVCGNVLGLHAKLDGNNIKVAWNFNKTAETGTLAVSSSVLASNTYAPAGTLNGTAPVDLWYLV